MVIAIAIGLAFGATLAWLCFLSWVVSRIAFKEELPERRAALTAGTAFLLGLASSLVMIFFVRDPLPFIPTDMRVALLSLLYYVPAALVDFLMLRAAYRKGWVDDAEPFR